MIFSQLRLSIATALLLCSTSAFAQWDAPANYYSNATGTGATLKSQLTSAMSSGHIQRTYGNFRYSAAIHDQDPANSSRIILAYSGLSNTSAWDSAATWNREHVWPQSRQPGSVSNGSQGNLGDPHALRPCNTQVNSDRGSMPFGFGDTTGNYRDLGTFWYVGDMCRGDIARSLFYSDTRWSSLGISLVNGNPSGNQMGDLASLLEWHYLDPPDEFERRRNHTIYSSSHNPQYYTNNRNAYVDRPEFVWSIYVDQMNDSTITIDGGIANASGTSSLQVDFGSVIVGTNISTDQTITLNKFGNDGTYFVVESFGNALSDSAGKQDAFKIQDPQVPATQVAESRDIDVSLFYDPQNVGDYTGAIMIDNIDITTQGGVGNGANDGNDFISLALKVVDHSNASFDIAADEDQLTINLGEITLGDPITPVDFSIYNLASQAGASLTAKLDLTLVSSTPQSSFLTFSGTTFQGLAADESSDLSIVGTPSQLGAGSTQFVFFMSDEDVPGAEQQFLQMIINYDVVDAFLLGDVNMDGAVDFLDIAPFITLLTNGTFLDEADCNQDGEVNFLDIAAFIGLLSA